MFFRGHGFESNHAQKLTFSDFPHVELEKMLSSVSPGNETAWMLTRPPVYPADLNYPAVSGGEECYKASFG